MPHSSAHTDLPQGDTGLIDTPIAQELLAAATPALLAYIALDGTPRNVPLNFHWNGNDVVMGAFAGTFKVAALQAHPTVAVTISTHHDGAKVLLLRGNAVLTDFDGLLPEYAFAHVRTVGGKASKDYLAAIDQPGLRMVRIALRPAWVGVLDFAERLPERTPGPVRQALT
ncbi:MAG: pyridoxamine 5'-phosphate oxidase [Mycobacteriaceae bacterium]|nr:pyridoxamine 5'-phosphate oxidase [Mycobacteriaceae bacterium]